MTIIEKIIARHSGREKVVPGEIVDVQIDVRLARDFGGANVVKNLVDNGLRIADPAKTWFTFDCNPTGSDQKYAANQQSCRIFAREHQIPVYDLNSGIGTHLAIDQGLALPGDTLRFEMKVMSLKRSLSKMRGEAFVGNDLVAEGEFMAMIQEKNK